MTPSVVLFAVLAYLLLLFFLARKGDKQHFVSHSWVRHPVVYSLALGVYCTSWTFYGLVGTASTKAWNFFPILLGPILLFTIGYPLLERIYTVCKQESIHSIADFMASRYGKRQGIAATISLVVLLATIPYIALQLKAVSDTLLMLLGNDVAVNQDMTLLIAFAMIVFTLLFGARRLDMSGYHSGLMSVIAFESLVKIIVLISVAGFVFLYFSHHSFIDTLTLHRQAVDASDHSSAFLSSVHWSRFIVETVLAMCAVFCLPRMFHITFVECLSIQHLRFSRWFFVAYLIIISLAVTVIASVGNQLFKGENIVGDVYVIALPLLNGEFWLAIVAFLGGFSAAMAMIIVATMTLSQMLSNDVVLPLLLRRHKKDNEPKSINNKQQALSHDFSKSIIFSRRLTVFLVIMGAYVYQNIFAENAALTSIGLIAFALVVQLAPAILYGLYWRKGNAQGLYAGLIVGLCLWFYTLMIPLLVSVGLMSPYIIEEGLWGLSWLRPEFLFNWEFSDSFTRSVIISLSANILFYCWYSVTSSETLVDRIQAAAFTNLEKGNYKFSDDVNIDDLQVLLQEFLGEVSTHHLLNTYYGDESEQARQTLLENAQKALANVVGVASSQAMLETLYSGKQMAVEEVVNLFGETTKALRFNQEVLSASFENISSGISVVDVNLRLIAWNQHYKALFHYPEGMLQVGLHVADIMRFNASRGMLGDGDVELLINKRLSYMVAGKEYRVVRFHQDDVVIEIKGQPLPNGGYVTTYDDITEFITAQRNLESMNATLEQRVKDRTEKIEEVNNNLIKEIHQRIHFEHELREAKQMAEDANALKTKFLALASHDIMQPLNAASLYASALSDMNDDTAANTNNGSAHRQNVVEQLKSAIQNTESIITALLEVSKLDNGVIQPQWSHFSLDELLLTIINEASVQLPETIELRYQETSLWVYSDKHYLYRIVQNFVSNAIKYTQQGKVLLGCRRVYRSVDNQDQSYVEICVYDNGMGIADTELTQVFTDFYRVSHKANHSSDTSNDNHAIPGVGLGLSVVSRFAELLNHTVSCRSQLTKGSCFSVRVPVSDQVGDLPLNITQPAYKELNNLDGLTVLYVDDEAVNLSATSILLSDWGCVVTTLNTIQAAQEYAAGDNPIPDVLIMDYQLDKSSLNGLVLAKTLLSEWKSQEDKEVSVCIVSAASEIDLPDRAAALGFQFLRKPIKPARLRALLTRFREYKSLVE